jgi:hypothetical protein
MSAAILFALLCLSSSLADDPNSKGTDAGTNKSAKPKYDRKKVYLIVVNQTERKAVEDVNGKLLPYRVYMRWEERLPELIDGKLKVTGGWGLDVTNQDGFFRDEPRQLLNRGAVLTGNYLGDEKFRRYEFKKGDGEFYDLWKETDQDKSFGYTTMLFYKGGKIVIGKPILKSAPVDP